MNKTLIALALAMSLGACAKNASDQPENATANAPSTATPSETTAAATPPSGNDSANAVANGNPSTGASDMSGTGTGSDLAAGGSAMGGTSTGGNSQYQANLDEELRRCDQLTGAERDTCRSDAQARYDQQGSTTKP